MSLYPNGHQDVTGPRSLTAMIRRYLYARPPGATTAPVRDWFKENPQCTR
jgi:hypothetical protein